MQNSRRNFLKRGAVVAGAVAVGSTAMAMSKKVDASDSSNGVVTGQSPKKEIIYRKTKQWEEYYKHAL